MVLQILEKYHVLGIAENRSPALDPSPSNYNAFLYNTPAVTNHLQNHHTWMIETIPKW